MVTFTEGLVQQLDEQPIYRYRVDRRAAQAMLDESCNVGNRPVTKATVLRYLSDMRDGRWLPTHSPLKFAWIDGRLVLIDGQHQLTAFLKSDLPYLDWYIAFGCEAIEFEVTDIGAKRRVSDLLRGVDRHNRNMAAIARTMYWGSVRAQTRQAPLTDTMLIAFEAEHHEAIAFATAMLRTISKKSGLAKAPVFGCIARASYSVDRAVLRIWTEAYKTGIYAEGRYQSAALLSRLLSRPSRPQGGSWDPAWIYGYASHALNACAKDRTIGKLVATPAGRELFAIPNDPQRVPS